jgi:hypothetical protein
MKEAIEEFGTAMICCIIGLIVVLGLSALIAHGGTISNFADAYADYFYSASEEI